MSENKKKYPCISNNWYYKFNSLFLLELSEYKYMKIQHQLVNDLSNVKTEIKSNLIKRDNFLCNYFWEKDSLPEKPITKNTTFKEFSSSLSESRLS